MKSALLLLLTIVILHSVCAQSKGAPEKQQIINEVGKNFNQGAVQTFDERYEGIQGTPFLSDQWTPGKVTMRNGKVFTKVQLKYDLYRDEIVVKHPYDHAVIPDKRTITQFSIDAQQNEDSLFFIRVDYLPNFRNFPPNRFAQVLYGSLSTPDASTLLALHTKKLIKADYQGGYNANRRYDEFSHVMTSYYLVKPNGQVYRFKPTLKTIRGLLKDKKGVIDQFLADETINPEDPRDLARLIRHYDQHQ